jgi:hypothetical protein
MPRSADGLTRRQRKADRLAARDADYAKQERSDVAAIMMTRGLTLSINEKFCWKNASAIVAHGNGFAGQLVIRCVGEHHRYRATKIIARYLACEDISPDPPRIDWPAGVVDIRRVVPRPADDDEPIGIVGRA